MVLLKLEFLAVQILKSITVKGKKKAVRVVNIRLNLI